MIHERRISDSYVFNIDVIRILSTAEVTFLDVFIDNKLIFKNHIDKLCKKASHKLQALRHIRPFFSFFTFLIGCLLVKVQLTKSEKFTSGHSKLFIMLMTNRMRS